MSNSDVCDYGGTNSMEIGTTPSRRVPKTCKSNFCAGPKYVLPDLVIWAMLLVPIAALLRRDLGTILSKDYSRVVADTPHIRVRAKLPSAVKCIMALMLLILIGLFWSQ